MMDASHPAPFAALSAAPGAPVDLRALGTELDARIATISAETPALTAARPAVIEEFRAALETGRELARRELEAGGKGLACARFLSDLEDELIRAIYRYVTHYVHVSNNPTFGDQLTIVAVGGYGRGALAPGSDIDLLFLLPSKQTPWGESVVEAILYVLWDLRQKVGHASRSIAECMSHSKTDMTIRTTLIEARFLYGNAQLFDELLATFEREIMRAGTREFVGAKLEERNTRVSRAGASRYLVEPNVKEGKGGLRDLNTLFWIAKYVYRVREARDLVGVGLLTSAEMSLFERCEEFLWSVRCHLHFATGRAEERLSFEMQPRLANRLGYRDRAGLSRVERFMKHYFLVAKDVGDLTAIVCAALELREAKPRPFFDRMFGTLRRRKVDNVPEDFTVDFGRLNTLGDSPSPRIPSI